MMSTTTPSSSSSLPLLRERLRAASDAHTATIASALSFPFHPDPPPSASARLDYARAARQAYDPASAAFPSWSLDWFERTIDDVGSDTTSASCSFDALARDVIVFVQRSSPSSLSALADDHDDPDSFGAFAWRLLAQREPANIAMDRLFHANILRSRLPAGLYQRTGAVTSYYQEWSTRHAYRALPPNIAVYCRTPFDLRANLNTAARVHVPANAASTSAFASSSSTPLPAHLDSGPDPRSSLAHVINVTGYAFDHPDQPDYQHFFGRHGDSNHADDPAVWTRLHHAYRVVFDHIFECALALPSVREIVFPRFGLGAFAGLLSEPQRARLSAEWRAALRASAEAYQSRLQGTRACASSVSLSLMGCDDEGWLAWETALRGGRVTIGTRYGYLPDALVRATQRQGNAQGNAEDGEVRHLAQSLDQLLVVNAWDPHTLVGNGNAIDNSIDGRIGRRSATALLCWPVVNPFMRLRVY